MFERAKRAYTQPIQDGVPARRQKRQKRGVRHYDNRTGRATLRLVDELRRLMRRMQDGTEARILQLMHTLSGRHLNKRFVRVQGLFDAGAPQDAVAKRVALICTATRQLLEGSIADEAPPMERVRDAVGKVLGSLPIELKQTTTKTMISMHDRCCFRWQTRARGDASYFSREMCLALASTFPQHRFCFRTHASPCEAAVENQILINV